MFFRLQHLLVILVDAVMAFIAFVLGMRIIFQLVKANPATPFVGFINIVSGYLMYPFQGMFPGLQISEFATLDLVALITLLAYSIIGYLIIMVIRMIFKPTVHEEVVHHEPRHIV